MSQKWRRDPFSHSCLEMLWLGATLRKGLLYKAQTILEQSQVKGPGGTTCYNPWVEDCSEGQLWTGGKPDVAILSWGSRKLGCWRVWWSMIRIDPIHLRIEAESYSPWAQDQQAAQPLEPLVSCKVLCWWDSTLKLRSSRVLLTSAASSHPKGT